MPTVYILCDCNINTRVAGPPGVVFGELDTALKYIRDMHLGIHLDYSKDKKYGNTLRVFGTGQRDKHIVYYLMKMSVL